MKFAPGKSRERIIKQDSNSGYVVANIKVITPWSNLDQRWDRKTQLPVRSTHTLEICRMGWCLSAICIVFFKSLFALRGPSRNSKPKRDRLQEKINPNSVIHEHPIGFGKNPPGHLKMTWNHLHLRHRGPYPLANQPYSRPLQIPSRPFSMPYHAFLVNLRYPLRICDRREWKGWRWKFSVDENLGNFRCGYGWVGARFEIK